LEGKRMESEQDKAPQEVKAIQIRFPASLYEELKRRSRESRRSFNAEVVVSLERLFASIHTPVGGL
jgi:hypothetical protein